MNLRYEVLEIVSLKIVWAKALLQPSLPLLSNFQYWFVAWISSDSLKLWETNGFTLRLVVDLVRLFIDVLVWRISLLSAELIKLRSSLFLLKILEASINCLSDSILFNSPSCSSGIRLQKLVSVYATDMFTTPFLSLSLLSSKN